MVPPALPTCRETALIRPDGRPTAAFREQLRQIPSWRNLGSLVGLYVQTGAVVVAAVAWGPWSWLPAIILMGRAHAQFASLMHEAAHRLLFSHKRSNDLAGRWLLGFPGFTSTDAYRRVHMAHHRDEFGPDEPDIPLYVGYPVAADSMRRKLVRDATGRTGVKLMRQLFRNARSTDPRSRRTFWKIMGVQALMLAASIVAGHWWVYPLLWVLPYLTVWRVINRLRSIAEHGGMHRSPDRRESTHSVHQGLLARTFLVPYRIGWHLAHHVDAGVPFRHLPRLQEALREASYIDDTIEWPGYATLWRALRAG